MDNDRDQGKIILINGASSAGKSTLARLLQQKLEVPFWHFSFDHLRDSNALPWSRILNRELDWSAMRPAVFHGFHRCLPVLAESGNNLIVDHIVETEEWLSDLLDLLSAFDVFVVGVHCPLSELVSRRRDRLTKLGRRGARLTRRLSESYQWCTASEGNAVSRDGSAEKWLHISATGH